MAYDIDLYAKVYDASRTRTTRDEVIDYYKEQFPGSRTNKKGQRTEEWRSKIADDLVGIATDKKGKPLSRASIMRRFQGGRGETGKIDPRVAKEYEQLGKKIPPKAPEGGYHIVGTVCIQYSQTCEERDIDITITGEDAKAFIKNPTMQGIINIYNVQDLDEEEPEADACEDENECRANLSITPLGDDEVAEDDYDYEEAPF